MPSVLAAILALGAVPVMASAASSKEIQQQIDGLKSKKAELQKEIDAYLQANPDIAEQVEAKVREQLMANSAAARVTAKAAERPIAVSADDFSDED